MKKEKQYIHKQFWQMLISKTFTDDATPLHNFKFQKKKKVPLLTKDFLPKFSELKVFHERVSCVKTET